MPNGLNDPDDPTQVGWGGCHEFGISPDRETSAWTNWQQPLKGISNRYEHQFYPDEFNDFAARMQWADTGSGNVNPVVVINGKSGLKPMVIKAKAGKKLTFDAGKSYDPDGDGIEIKWWFQNFPTQKNLDPHEYHMYCPRTGVFCVTLPDEARGNTYHLICEIHDDGPYNLTAYRRIIIECR